MIDIRIRMVLMGCAGFIGGLLLGRLPGYAAAGVLLMGVGWAVHQLISVNRDIRRIKAMIQDIELDMLRDDG